MQITQSWVNGSSARFEVFRWMHVWGNSGHENHMKICKRMETPVHELVEVESRYRAIGTATY